MTTSNGFSDYLQAKYPALIPELAGRGDLISDHLLSPGIVVLPLKVRDQIHDAVAAVHQLRQILAKQIRASFHPQNFSTMMSLDFHLDENHNLKLIEINTNAAFLILGTEMYLYRGITNPVGSFSSQTWKQDLIEELSLARPAPLHGQPAVPFVVISDQTPSQQRLFIEFLVAREWIKSWGWTSDIRDFKEAMKSPSPDLIYNRSTDFNLSESDSQDVKAAYEQGRICLSPTPFEYSLLADKERLIEWSQPEALENLKLDQKSCDILRGMLPRTIHLTKDNAEEIWSSRKNLFFKPKREFGSKKAFRGSSISRKMFDELLGGEMLAQEFIPAPELLIEADGLAPTTFKYDLRCHFYQDRLEGIVARTYQGQVTNLKTPGGGFTPVTFS